MDNKPLELEALRYFESLVSRYGYQYAELNFDTDGRDFIIIKEDDNCTYRYLRCQSKGRSLYPNASHITIPKSYIRDNFVVFAYLKPEDVDATKAYLFTTDDIKRFWSCNDDSYRLNLTKDFSNKPENERYLLNKDRASVISDLLVKAGEESQKKLVQAMSEVEFYYKIWQKTGGLPPFEYLCDVFEGDDLFDIMSSNIFVFLLCASVIQNIHCDFRLSIDWAFLTLKTLKRERVESKIFREGKTFYSDVAITYPSTWVKELLSDQDILIGYQLHIGDKEESADVWVFRNEDW